MPAPRRPRRSEPWVVSFLDPDTDDPTRLASAVSQHPDVLAARIRDQTGYGGRAESWLEVTVDAASADRARRLAHDAVFPLVWPPERLATLQPRWVVGIGRHTETRRSTDDPLEPDTPQDNDPRGK